MKIILQLLTIALVMGACGGGQKSELPPPKKLSEAKAVTPEEAMKDWKNNKGIGPIKSVTLGGDVDQAMVEDGQKVFEELCTACHKVGKKFIGPAPDGIMTRRTPEWIMNMILNPVEMTQQDPIAKQLLIESNGAPMANQGLTEDQARAILEYFRTLE